MRLTTITIGDGCTTIESQAFYQSTRINQVRTIYIGKNISTIGSDAFSYMGSQKIYCKATTPPLLSGAVFGTGYEVTIYVPRASVADYRTIWSNYASRILGYDFE